jgi:hydrogenase maturation protein HypF
MTKGNYNLFNIIAPGLKRFQVRVTGIVQGVGFRPFIFRIAQEFKLTGWVLNDSQGVIIEVEGDQANLETFLYKLKTSSPPRSRIESLEIKEVNPLGENSFKIKNSLALAGRNTLISPDIATCEDCLAELQDPKDYRYQYPFINCTNCGPRFTIIKSLPYDRIATTMSSFIMCPVCSKEYHDPLSRRFHAQPNACKLCGPLPVIAGKDLPDPIAFAGEKLKAGEIIGIKGLGGFHLACDATNAQAVKRLRLRKGREGKPLALMVKDLEAIKKICRITSKEISYLQSFRRPIVLLKKLSNPIICEEVAPGQKYLGVMLPYTPLHYLLFNFAPVFLVMTSGNFSDEPILYENADAQQELKDVADYFLVHNREIYTRCDDSVGRIFKGQPYLIRRSRGYAPDAIRINTKFNLPVLGCGGELKHTFCLGKANFAFLSPHIGDLKNPDNLKAFMQDLEHYVDIFDCKPQVLAYDLHPQYLSTLYALERPDVKKIGIQHHFAHLGSVLAEHNIKEKIIGVTFDGSGYGEDGALWGGEWLVGDLTGYQRVAHLDYVPLLGGDKAAREPWRMLLAHLYPVLGEGIWKLKPFNFLKLEECSLLLQMLDARRTKLFTSSLGRLFDAVSALLGLCRVMAYEGEAAMLLEMKVKQGKFQPYKFNLEDSKLPMKIFLNSMWEELLADLQRGTHASLISARFHHTVAEMVNQVCRKIRKHYGINKVGLSGGVWQNLYLLKRGVAALEDSGFKVYLNRQVPPNDGGISLGQAAIANALLR